MSTSRRQPNAEVSGEPRETNVPGRRLMDTLRTGNGGDARPLHSLGAQRELERFSGMLMLISGEAQELRQAQANEGALTVDTLRQLDADPKHAPKWLRLANQKALVELAAWYISRGFGKLLTSDEDPGEPDHDTAVLDLNVLYPRPLPTTPDQRLVEYLKCRQSPVYFLDSYCSLRHSVQGTIPFRLWDWQAWLLVMWGKHTRNIVLKARQLGASELAAGINLWDVLFHDTRTSLFISKGDLEAGELLERAKTMYVNLPQWLMAGTRESVERAQLGKVNVSTFTIVHFSEDGRPRPSVINSLPATIGTGRSRTASSVVLDEWAFQLWGEQIWAAVKPTVDAGGLLIGISTANGLGGTFHRMWTGAVKSENGFFSVFLSWRRHPDRTPDWYERTKKESEIWQLHQEYPSEPTEAFIQTGRPVFDSTYITAHERRIDEEIAAGFAPYQPHLDGITLYEAPMPGHRYIIGADVSEGNEDGDYDAAVVIDRETLHEVAFVHGRWRPEVYAGILYQIGHRFNDALLAVERNNHGHAVLLALNSDLASRGVAGMEHKPYPNVYHHSEALVPGRRQDARPGWHTNVATKPLVIDALARALREDLFLVRNKAFLEEALIFSYQDTGFASAPRESGFHDDYVMAYAIAIHICLRPDSVAYALAFVKELREKIDTKVATIGPRHAQPSTSPQTAVVALESARKG